MNYLVEPISYHLEEGQVSMPDVVEGDLWVDPGVVLLRALPPVVHDVSVQSLSIPTAHSSVFRDKFFFFFFF